jgi:hypothetical protein
VLEREVVDGDDDGAGRERRRGVLDVQEVYGPPPQFRREREGDAHQRRVRERAAHPDVRPAPVEALERLLLRHVDAVTVLRADFGQRLDEVRRVSLVPRQPRPDRVRVNRDVQGKLRRVGVRCLMPDVS